MEFFASSDEEDSAAEVQVRKKARKSISHQPVICKAKVYLGNVVALVADALASEDSELAELIKEANRLLSAEEFSRAEEIAGKCQERCWRVICDEKSRAKSCWKESFVIAKLIQSVSCLALGGSESCLEHADMAFIMGAPKEEVNLIFRLVNSPSGNGKRDLSSFPDEEAFENICKNSDTFPSHLSPHVDLSRPIEVLEDPSLESLRNSCPSTPDSFPVLIKNMVSDWEALKKWQDLNYFAEYFGKRLVPIEIGSKVATMEEKVLSLETFVTDFLDKRCKKRYSPIAYLAQHNLLDQIPQLQRDIKVPSFCSAGGAKVVASSVWMGTDATTTLLHFDSYDNFLVQVAGMKFVLLFRHSETSRLYVNHGGESCLLSQGNTSGVDVARPDLTKFPMYQNTPATAVLLKPGDTLFIPKECWHYVFSLTPSLSVNFWFEQ